jgi:glycosyltransferase involved in cell wall biosynthesis
MLDGSKGVAQHQASRKVLVLVDEDITLDRRVLSTLAKHSTAEVIDCNDPKLAEGVISFRAYLKVVYFLLAAAIQGVHLWRILGHHYGLHANAWIVGLRISMATYIKAQRVADALSSKIGRVRLIHAHDLYCGVIGAELSRLTGAELIYDAHEVEFHRNRKASWMRTAFDWIVEQRVIARASEVRVVNSPIADLYQRVHESLDGRLRVVPNNHFAMILLPEFAQMPAPETAVIVYVGGGVKGRRLECLAERAVEMALPVHAYFIGEVPEFAKTSGWVVSGGDYEDDLVNLVAVSRCMMWCCVENTCLSYRLSLPNKFFQALAVGIPVIVSSGGYLEELVTRYEIGVVFNGNNFNQIVKQIKSDQFQFWGMRVRSFNEECRKRRLRL